MICTLISIHTPHAGSDVIMFIIFGHLTISIHTPHAGSDQATFIVFVIHVSFQSTLPMRGVTFLHPVSPVLSAISIHTPHAGSDRCKGYDNTRHNKFQSTLPMRGVTQSQISCKSPNEFQSTLPMRGVTNFRLFVIYNPIISIHTPHAGSDCLAIFSIPTCIYFNPHSPCGE